MYLLLIACLPAILSSSSDERKIILSHNNLFSRQFSTMESVLLTIISETEIQTYHYLSVALTETYKGTVKTQSSSNRRKPRSCY